MIEPSYHIQPITVEAAADLCRRFHGYKGAGKVATYAFGVIESGRLVAAYIWNPPAPGAALALCPEAVGGVLALTRMVAVPREERTLNHVSKPLRRQMRHLIDRGRWPVLVTYHDESQGHTGHVYKCSGWTPTERRKATAYTSADGERISSYSAGGRKGADVLGAGVSVWLQRWEHWACPIGGALEHMTAAGWRLENVPGKIWRSGNPARRWVRQHSLF